MLCRIRCNTFRVPPLTGAKQVVFQYWRDTRGVITFSVQPGAVTD